MISLEAATYITLSFISLSTSVTALEQLRSFRYLEAFIGYSVAGRNQTKNERNIGFTLLLFRIIFGLLLIISCQMDSHIWVKVFVFLSAIAHFTFSAIRPVGGDGADQMQGVVYSIYSISFLLTEYDLALTISAYFVTAHLFLSYCTTGFAKLNSPAWREGNILKSIFSTYSYGHEKFFLILNSSPILNRAGTYFPIFVFSMTPVFFIQPYQSVFLIYLMLAGLFHIFTGVIMGLNNFALTFPATYPCALYGYQALHAQMLLYS